MSFAYRLRKSADTSGNRTGDAPAILVCDLGRPEGCELALTIAGELTAASRRDVTLLSDLAAVAGAEQLELAPLNRSPTYEGFVAVEKGEPMRLSARMISLAASLRISGVRRIGAAGRNGPYVRPPDPAAKRALFVFPGIFAPPRIGSHQRAFSTVLDLIEEGFDVDIVVKRSGRRLIDRVKPYFDLCSSRLASYEVRRRSGDDGAGPPKPFMLEREAEDIDEGAKGLVAGMIAAAEYRLIVVSYPWMLAILNGARPRGVRIVCDTHDVITNRQRELAEEGDPMVGEAESLEAEREALAHCDAVLAISRSDARLFEEALGLTNVAVQPISYHAAEPTLEWRSGAGPLTFGFIGSDMPANRRALEFIMTRWWPIIERFSPESRIVIAGAIATSPAVSPYVILRKTVTVAGFVEDLNAFFGSVDVMLSPSIVQAGVNVKNVEALLRRRPVITNALGAKSLEPLVIPTRCETDEGFLTILRKLDRNDPGMMAELETLFEEAVALHSKPMRLAWA